MEGQSAENPAPARNALKAALADYVGAGCDRLQSLNMPKRTWWTATSFGSSHPGFSSGERVDVDHVVTSTEYALRRLQQFRAILDVLTTIPDPASNVVRRARRAWIGPKAHEGLRRTGEAESVVQALVGPLLTRYFRLAGTGQFKPDAFEQVVEPALESAFTEGVVVERLIPLTELQLSDEVVEIAEGTTLREITAEDIEMWANTAGPTPGLGDSPLPTYHLLSLRTAAVLRRHYADGALALDDARMDGDIQQLLSALRLALDVDVHVAFWEESRSDRWQTSRTTTVRTPSGRSAHFKLVDHTGAEVARKVWLDLGAETRSPNVELAFRRWNDACSRSRADDKLIDYWIALEAVFVSDSTQEVKYRASLRIAAFLGRSPTERIEIYESMRNSYDCRSAIVHGTVPKKFKVPEVETSTRVRLRRALLLLLATRDFDPSRVELQLLSQPESTVTGCG